MKCVHHWEIAPAVGRWSIGKCRRCPLQRTFDNRPDSSTFNAAIWGSTVAGAPEIRIGGAA